MAEDVTEADFNSYISAANAKISAFDLEIRSTYHQTTRQRIYSLVNSTSDAISQLATIHTAEEISFLKRVLDAMFETFNTKRHEVMAINSMQAMKYGKPPSEDRRESQNGATQGSSGQGLTLVQAEKMLKTLVDEGWFEKSRKGFYSLSTRALMELRGWLIETYNDPDDEDDEEQIPKIKQCIACKEIITVVGDASIGQCCQDLMLCRDNDATKRAVHAGCTTFAPRISSESKNRRGARFARQSGVARPTWASARSPLLIRIHRLREEATLHLGENHVLARSPTWLTIPMTSKITIGMMRRKKRMRMRTKRRRKMEKAMRKRILDTPRTLVMRFSKSAPSFFPELPSFHNGMITAVVLVSTSVAPCLAQVQSHGRSGAGAEQGPISAQARVTIRRFGERHDSAWPMIIPRIARLALVGVPCSIGCVFPVQTERHPRINSRPLQAYNFRRDTSDYINLKLEGRGRRRGDGSRLEYRQVALLILLLPFHPPNLFHPGQLLLGDSAIESRRIHTFCAILARRRHARCHFSSHFVPGFLAFRLQLQRRRNSSPTNLNRFTVDLYNSLPQRDLGQ